MSKRKKTGRLSDGRLPWEPKPATLERRKEHKDGDVSFFPEDTIFPPIVCSDILEFVERNLGCSLTASQSKKLVMLAFSKKERWLVKIGADAILCDDQLVGVAKNYRRHKKEKLRKTKPLFAPFDEAFPLLIGRKFSLYMETFKGLLLKESPDGFASHYEPFAWAETELLQLKGQLKTLSSTTPVCEVTSLAVALDVMGCAESGRKNPALTKTMGVGSELLESLIRTELPENLKDIAPPIPYGVVFFSKESLDGKFSDFPCWVAFSFLNEARSIPTLTQSGEERWSQFPPMLTDDNEITYYLTAPSFCGGSLTLASRWAGDGVSVPESSELEPLEREYRDFCFKLATNFLAYLASLDNKKSTEQSRSLRQLSIARNPKDLRSLQVYDIVNQQSVARASSSHPHSSPSPHWRRGHWRNQACGEGLGNRRLIWVRPTIVGVA